MRQKTASPLRQMRRTRTMTQEQLAALADISQESLSRAERGVMGLRPDVQARLAAILGTSVADLFPQATVTA